MRDAERLLDEYLGDGAYVYLSPCREVVLYTSDGIEEKNTVVLDDVELAALERWLDRMRSFLAEHDQAPLGRPDEDK